MTANTELLTTSGHDDPEVSGHDAKRGGMDAALLGMMLFIASEVMFFAALFAAYFNAKATLPVWPPEGYEDVLQALPGAAHRDRHPHRLARSRCSGVPAASARVTGRASTGPWP